MRMFMCIAALVTCGFVNDCFAGERQRGVEFKIVTPCDLLLGTGVFIQDTGKNVVGGVRTTVKGLGELITAPLRARILIPKRRTFRYIPPKFYYRPGKFRELVPPTIFIPPSAPPAPPAPPATLHGGDIHPLRFVPVPERRYKNIA